MGYRLKTELVAQRLSLLQGHAQAESIAKVDVMVKKLENDKRIEDERRLSIKVSAPAMHKPVQKSRKQKMKSEYDAQSGLTRYVLTEVDSPAGSTISGPSDAPAAVQGIYLSAMNVPAVDLADRFVSGCDSESAQLDRRLEPTLDDGKEQRMPSTMEQG